MEAKMFDKEAGKKALQFFSSLSDETRLNILLSLVDCQRNVSEIYEYVGKNRMTLSAISHQLRRLSDIGLVFYKKEGKEKKFSLSDNFCWCILRDALNHFNSKTECESCKKLRVKKRKGIR